MNLTSYNDHYQNTESTAKTSPRKQDNSMHFLPSPDLMGKTDEEQITADIILIFCDEIRNAISRIRNETMLTDAQKVICNRVCFFFLISIDMCLWDQFVAWLLLMQTSSFRLLRRMILTHTATRLCLVYLPRPLSWCFLQPML